METIQESPIQSATADEIEMFNASIDTYPLLAGRKLALQRSVTRALSEDGSVPVAASNILRAICVLGGWEFGELWLVDGNNRWLRSVAHWLDPKLEGIAVGSVSRRSSFQKGTGLAGSVWKDRKATWLNGGFHAHNLAYTTATAKKGFKTVFASPILDRHIVIGVMSLYCLNSRPPDKAFEEFMITVGNQVGEFILRTDAEESLKQHRHVFQSLIENSWDAITLLNPEGKILYASPSFERILGYDVSSIVGREALPFIHPRDRERVRTALETIIKDPAKRVITTYRVPHFEGTWRWMEATCMNMLADPAVRAIVANNRDITGHKEIEDKLALLNLDLEKKVRERTSELQSANDELESFSYSVAHDLRAPLRAINGFTQMLVEDDTTKLGSEGERLVGVIQTNVGRMGHLIDDLLAFSRVGRMEIASGVKVNMTQLVEDLVADVKKSLDKKDEIHFVIGRLARARCSEPMIRQVWINLISNAVKFTRDAANRTIEIGCSSKENQTVYFIKDNGLGFDMRHTQRLFGLFQRLHAGTLFEGTGVGLAIVKRIVERHHGQLWVEAAVNKGATFYFSIPK